MCFIIGHNIVHCVLCKKQKQQQKSLKKSQFSVQWTEESRMALEQQENEKFSFVVCYERATSEQ